MFVARMIRPCISLNVTATIWGFSHALVRAGPSIIVSRISVLGRKRRNMARETKAGGPSLGRIVTEEEIPIIADEYLQKWEDLYPYLKLKSGTDEVIGRARGYRNEKRVCLQEWKTQHGDGATYRVLIEAAEKSRNKLLADRLRSMLQESSTTASRSKSSTCRGGDPSHNNYN